jgi:hypothetical protein
MDLNLLELILSYLFPIVDAAPTEPPRLPIGFALYKNGATKRAYIYFSGGWSYLTLT